MLMCYSCYFKELIALQRTFQVYSVHQVVENFDGLTADEKWKVQDISYKNAESYCELSNSNTHETTSKKEAD